MKIDLNLDRSITLNTGNYSSIKPGVSITLKDIDASNLAEMYKKASEVLDALMAREIIALSDEQVSITDMGWRKYVIGLNNHLDEIDDVITNYYTEQGRI